MTQVFVKREENFLPLPVLLKLVPTSDHNNSFLLLELCRTCVGLLRAGFIRESLHLQIISPHCLSHLMTYLADFLDNQHCLGEKILSPEDYTSATHRCLWYLQSSSRQVILPLLFSFSLTHTQQHPFFSYGAIPFTQTSPTNFWHFRLP